MKWAGNVVFCLYGTRADEKHEDKHGNFNTFWILNTYYSPGSRHVSRLSQWAGMKPCPRRNSEWQITDRSAILRTVFIFPHCGWNGTGRVLSSAFFGIRNCVPAGSSQSGKHFFPLLIYTLHLCRRLSSSYLVIIHLSSHTLIVLPASRSLLKNSLSLLFPNISHVAYMFFFSLKKTLSTSLLFRGNIFISSSILSYFLFLFFQKLVVN